MPTTLTRHQFVDVTDMVVVRNEGSTTIRWTWESRPYVIQPGEARLVPFFLATNWLGDPRAKEKADSVNVRGVSFFVPSRSGEVGRLCLLYGLPLGRGDELKRVAPKITVSDQGGVPMSMVVDDLEGLDLLPSTPSEIKERDILQHQIEVLTSRLDALDGDTQVTTDDGEEDYDVEADSPPDYSQTFKSRKRDDE